MKKIGFVIACIFLVFGQSCKSDDPFTGDCFIPDAGVSITVNMDLPEYYNLRNLGEYISFEEQGNKGIYLIHNYDDIFYAIERTCPYQSDNACAQVVIDTEILQYKCGQQVDDTTFNSCCGSAYDLNSGFLSGPARCNLKTYRVAQNGNSLYVSN